MVQKISYLSHFMESHGGETSGLVDKDRDALFQEIYKRYGGEKPSSSKKVTSTLWTCNICDKVIILILIL